MLRKDQGGAGPRGKIQSRSEKSVSCISSYFSPAVSQLAQIWKLTTAPVQLCITSYEVRMLSTAPLGSLLLLGVSGN